MNLKLNIFSGGLVFSKFCIGMHNCLIFDEIDNLYFDVTDSRCPKSENFNFVFDQTLDDTYLAIRCKYIGTYGLGLKTKTGNEHLGLLELSPHLKKYKDIAKKIKIKKYILERVEKYEKLFEINDKTLGVHLRTTGNNIHHPYWGVHYTEDYITKIDEILETEEINNIFLASDNDESLSILKYRYGNRINFIDDVIRTETENTMEWFWHGQRAHDELDNPKLWEQIFVDVLLLAKCPIFLCRLSNVPHGVMMLSPLQQKIYRPFNRYGGQNKSLIIPEPRSETIPKPRFVLIPKPIRKKTNTRGGP